MADRDEIVAFLDDLLDARAFPDYGPNGLQVPGSAEVRTVATGVSAHGELFERAADVCAELLVCHHGLFWDKGPRIVTAGLRARLERLFAADMSLVAYHLPLDAHPEVGNNALLCEALGLEAAEPFGEHAGRAIGIVGRTREEELPTVELLRRCGAALGREPLVFDYGPPAIRSVGIVSGGGGSSLAEAIERGLDAFLTGEPEEYAMAEAREAGIHFIAGGHYATETLGVQRLGELIARRFGVEHRFIDVPNPV